jgi:hypothetical protein
VKHLNIAAFFLNSWLCNLGCVFDSLIDSRTAQCFPPWRQSSSKEVRLEKLPTLIAKREPPGFTESQIGSQAGILGRH